MQFGHVPLALAIATYDWSPRTAVFCLAAHMLPNADSLVVRAGFAKPSFHCTVTHSIFFATVVSALVYLVSPHYAPFAMVAILTHYLADIGSTVGQPLLWPFHKKSYTLDLFEDTGYWGWGMLTGYYRQPMSWLLEGTVIAFFLYRLSVVTG